MQNSSYLTVDAKARRRMESLISKKTALVWSEDWQVALITLLYISWVMSSGGGEINRPIGAHEPSSGLVEV